MKTREVDDDSEDDVFEVDFFNKKKEIEVKDPHLVSKEISSVSFSFYDPKEAREISVKRVTNPVLFDALNNPVVDGLYDPAFGPIEQFGVCSTCGLSQHHCPGQFWAHRFGGSRVSPFVVSDGDEGVKMRVFELSQV